VANIGRPPGEVQTNVAHSVGPVHILGGAERQDQRPIGADVYGNIGATTDLAGVEGVLHSHVQRHVARDNRHTNDVNLARGKSDC
jgi:hypothetical protein